MLGVADVSAEDSVGAFGRGGPSVALVAVGVEAEQCGPVPVVVRPALRVQHADRIVADLLLVTRHPFVVVPEVHVQGVADVLEVRRTAGLPGQILRLPQGGHQHGHQQRDDGDDHQQFDKRESVAFPTGWCPVTGHLRAPSILPPPCVQPSGRTGSLGIKDGFFQAYQTGELLAVVVQSIVLVICLSRQSGLLWLWYKLVLHLPPSLLLLEHPDDLCM